VTIARLTFFLVFLALSPAMAPVAAYCGAVEPVARVNGQVITQFELDQRILFLRALNIPGDLDENAMERLVDERLQTDAARRAGINVGDSDVSTGMEEFAARSDMSSQQFVEAIGQAGVARESFADFVRAGLAWRRLVSGLFSARAQVSDAEIDRAVTLGSLGSGARVLVSEIFLPAETPEQQAAAQRLAQEIGRRGTAAEFAAAARRYSAAASARRGGRQDWVPVDSLPTAYRNRILSLSPGEITDPIPLPNAVAVFLLHGVEESGRPQEVPLSVDYASYLIPGGQSETAQARAREVAGRVDTCDDLHGVAVGQSEDRLRRETVPVAGLRSDIASALETLDENEISTSLLTEDGEMLIFLMLCSRTFAATEDVDRGVIRQRLFNQRLASYAESYLAELRAQAVIEFR